MSKLTVLQKSFCHEYLCDLNAPEAYFRAGYKPASRKQARDAAARLLKRDNVAQYLGELMKTRSLATDITAERVLIELGRIGFSDLREYMSWANSGARWRSSDELSDDAAAAIAEIYETEREMEDGGMYRTKRFKLHDKMTALKELAKHTGLTGPGTSAVNINIGAAAEEDEKKRLELYEELFQGIEAHRNEMDDEETLVEDVEKKVS